MSIRFATLLLLLSTFSLAAQELKIDRRKPPSQLAIEGLPKGWEKLKGNLYCAHFSVSQSRRYHFAHSGSTRDILENFGVPFPDGATASYNPQTSVLTVTSTRDALEMTGALVLQDFSSEASLVSLRIEIYSVSSLQALQISESCLSETDHTPERNAILAAVKKTNAMLITSYSLPTTLGQRAKLEDTISFNYRLPSSTEKNKIKTRGIGTIIEYEAAIHSGDLIGINLALEHHTAAPEKGKDSDLRFHAKTINSDVNVPDGKHKLVGIWKPTGKPEHSKTDQRHVVFITANLQKN